MEKLKVVNFKNDSLAIAIDLYELSLDLDRFKRRLVKVEKLSYSRYSNAYNRLNNKEYKFIVGRQGFANTMMEIQNEIS